MQTDVIIVVGQRGCGKTTWAKRYIQKLPRVIVLDANFGEFGIPQFNTVDELVASLSGKTFYRASYSPLQYEVPLMFDIARIKGSESGKGCHLVIEEADRLDDPLYFTEYDESISRGRHYGVSLLAISLYPAKLPAMLRRMATRVIAFRHIEPKDIKYLSEIMGEDARKLPDLKNFEYIDWRSNVGSEIRKL